MFKAIFRHKIAVIIVIIAILAGGYFKYKASKSSADQTSYVLKAVEKGTIISSVSGSGQISASDQVDIKSTVSGDIISVNIQNGQSVKKGSLLVQLDDKDALKTVRDAKSNLDSAKLALEKLKQPADANSILQAENTLKNARDSLEKLKPSQQTDYQSAKDNLDKLKLSQQTDYQRAQEAKQKAEDNISKAYEDYFNTISDTFLDLPNIIAKLNDILYSYEISSSEHSTGEQENDTVLINSISVGNTEELQVFEASAQDDYSKARSEYDVNFDHYKSISRYSNQSDIKALLAETLVTTKAVAQAAKSESNFLDKWTDLRSQENKPVFSTVKGYQTNLSTYIGQTSNHITSLLSIQRTLQDSLEAIDNAEIDLKTMDQNNPIDIAAAEASIKEMEQNNPLDLAAAEASIKERESSLDKLKEGPDALDIQSQEITIRQREDAVTDANEKLADYYIKAPFDGVIANIDIKNGDNISSGAVVATIITKQHIAQISLNEVDAAKVKVGQKATLTFDAISDLSVAGEVAEVDTLGTVTQGVVTYGVQIGFDTQDEKIKPGMSVSAAIIIDSRQDVLLIPNSALKSSGDINYVEMLDGTPTQNQASNGEVASDKPPRQQQVETGLSNDTSTEIASGLLEGDMIILRTANPSSTSTQTAQTGQRSIFQVGGGTRSAIGH